jgi:hypothetical protein
MLWAKTPDSDTPANENVCDDLQAATPGLYGLCVAYCEAQDVEPFDTDGLDSLEHEPANPKLLNVYNSKKQEGDPDMPCVKIEDPNLPDCPCWSQEELDKIFTRTAPAGQRDSDQCFSISSPPAVKDIHYIVEVGGSDADWFFATRAYVTEEQWGNYVGPACEFYDQETVNWQSLLNVHRFILLNLEEREACISDILTRADTAGVECHVVQ